ncbi:MAG: RHS repeat-associated core domain-containing protein [Usitatibacter sp.]
MWRWDNTEAFGNSQPNEDPSALGAFTYNLRFPGQYFDAESGTNYNYFRDYDPRIGRYLRSDPVGLQAGLNTFSYVEASPLGLIDPDGTESSGSDPYPNCPRTPDGAMCRAGLETPRTKWSPFKGTAAMSINVQLGKVYGVVPFGIAFACNLGPDGISGTYLGFGIVMNSNGNLTSTNLRASYSSSSGSPSGWGVRANATSGPVAAGMGVSGSLYSNCYTCKAPGDGSAANFGIGPTTNPSGSFTFGYRGR